MEWIISFLAVLALFAALVVGSGSLLLFIGVFDSRMPVWAPRLKNVLGTVFVLFILWWLTITMHMVIFEGK